MSNVAEVPKKERLQKAREREAQMQAEADTAKNEMLRHSENLTRLTLRLSDCRKEIAELAFAEMQTD